MKTKTRRNRKPALALARWNEDRREAGEARRDRRPRTTTERAVARLVT